MQQVISDRLASEAEKTVAFFRELPQELWSQKMYSDGAQWTVHQIFAHIVQAEDAVARLIAGIVAGGAGAPEDFDLDRYNERKVREFEAESVDGLLSKFAERRANTVNLVNGMSEEDLETQGNHPFLGKAPVRDMLKLMYTHTQLHQRDIRRFMNSE